MAPGSAWLISAAKPPFSLNIQPVLLVSRAGGCVRRAHRRTARCGLGVVGSVPVRAELALGHWWDRVATNGGKQQEPAEGSLTTSPLLAGLRGEALRQTLLGPAARRGPSRPFTEHGFMGVQAQ
jgi:hypothetical protein